MSDILQEQPAFPLSTLPALRHEDRLFDIYHLTEILKELGINVRGTRIDRYRRYLEAIVSGKEYDHNAFFNDPENCPIQHELDRELYVMREIHELVWIARGIQQHLPVGSESKLRLIVGGQDFAALDQNTIARDTQFELRIASYFCRQGYEVDLSTDTDIIAQSKKESFYIECKRVASERQARKNLHKAAKQLANRMPNPKLFERKSYGIIALDLSAVAYPNNGVGYGYVADQMKLEIQEKLRSIQVTWTDSHAALGNLQNILIWKQIHMPGIVMYPRTILTRFSNLFEPYPFLFLRKRRAFSRLQKVLHSTDGNDPRLESPKPLQLKKSVEIPTGTTLSWDMELLEGFAHNQTIPEMDDEQIVLEANTKGEDLVFSAFELKFAVANLTEEHIAIVRDEPEQAMNVLTGALFFWRDPFEDSSEGVR